MLQGRKTSIVYTLHHRNIHIEQINKYTKYYCKTVAKNHRRVFSVYREPSIAVILCDERPIGP